LRGRDISHRDEWPASTEQIRAGTRDKDAKNSKCRTLALSEIAVEELRKHRLAQAQELLRLGVRLTDDTYVVAQADGQPLQPNSLTHAVRLFMKERAGKVRLHGLRHSHASHMLASNVHPKIVQERFGHSSISVTMDIYSHLMPNMQADAVARVDDVLQNAMLRRKAGEGTENKR
jgi:integrase